MVFRLKEFRAEVGFEFEFVVEPEGNITITLQVMEVVAAKEDRLTWRYHGLKAILAGNV